MSNDDIPEVFPGDNIQFPFGTDHDKVQYGYRTPDGEEHWGYPLDFAHRPQELRFQEGQDAAQEAFYSAIRMTGAVPDDNDKLVFLERREQVRFTMPHELVPEVVVIPEPEPLPEPEPEEEPVPATPEGPEPEPLEPIPGDEDEDQLNRGEFVSDPETGEPYPQDSI